MPGSHIRNIGPRMNILHLERNCDLELLGFSKWTYLSKVTVASNASVVNGASPLLLVSLLSPSSLWVTELTLCS